MRVAGRYEGCGRMKCTEKNNIFLLLLLYSRDDWCDEFALFSPFSLSSFSREEKMSWVRKEDYKCFWFFFSNVYSRVP